MIALGIAFVGTAHRQRLEITSLDSAEHSGLQRLYRRPDLLAFSRQK
jgi:hypothetical protein